ncbi:MAG: ribosome small subunit-dependent GTPase A [Bacteroidota bacterium]|nr:ribosome small subunit-dependent GTPase A [Bacteroidota bacterium]
MKASSETFEREKQHWIETGFVIARIAAEHKGRYSILYNNDVVPAEVTGKFMFDAETRKDYPAVGDFVAVQMYDDNNMGMIHHILPRKTFISRKTSGKEIEEQLIAANIDIAFIVQGLDHNFNLRRLERFLVVVREGGARPIILLSKTDLLSDQELAEKISQVKVIAGESPVIAYSAKTLIHIEEIKKIISPDTTVCFVGSSGVGKSTLINRFVGKELLFTQEVREEDSRGRHTTTRRELIMLKNGGYVIDTPGIRELGLWTNSGSIAETFADIAELAAHCKFTDCTHVHEPNCAVLRAIEDEKISRERYESYLKLRREAAYLESKTNITKQMERKAVEKKLSKDIYTILKLKKKK